jgi:hypothetical protein
VIIKEDILFIFILILKEDYFILINIYFIKKKNIYIAYINAYNYNNIN